MATRRSASRPQLTDEQERVLHRSACEVIAASVNDKPAKFSDATLADAAETPVAGVFVTAERRDRLRGCCGSLGPDTRLFDALGNAAVRTATEDNRMPPISPSELPFLHVDVYLLFGLRQMTSQGLSRIGEIKIGRHGLRIQRGNQAGLLLPSVAVEHDVDAEGFLRMVCRKAGLPSTAWKDSNTQLLTFEGHSIAGDFDTDVIARFSTEKAAPLTESELQQMNVFCKSNVIALARGAIPNYYLPGVSDGTVVGVEIGVHIPGRDVPLRISNFNLRPGVPLQSTLFKLCEASANALQSAGIQGDAVDQITTGVTVLHDAAMNGTLSVPDLDGVDTATRALLAIEGAKNVWTFNRDVSADELLESVAADLHPINPEAAALFSMAALSTESPVTVSNVPKPKAGADVRVPAVAGSFYPGNADELAKTVDEMLSSNGHSKQHWPALMVPHAGLKFSGRLVAEALQQVEIPRTVIVLGPKHTRNGVDWAVAPHETWSIPGATLANDVDLAKRLAEEIPNLQLDAAAHQLEHAIEVELPFLAKLAPQSRVVGIALGGGTFEQCVGFAEGLVRVIQSMSEAPLLVISSDMNHFASDDENRRLDEIALAAMERLNPQDLFDTVRQHDISMCGMLPAVIVMQALQQMGSLTKCLRTGYATSADVTGDTARVVGYAGMLLG
ncbi:MAG: AmmeMemoRadiSam system protein B [Planctomycetota bacterium]|nr:AmmeMemoRadiSam system protein B [Planctomycetota bacterium]